MSKSDRPIRKFNPGTFQSDEQVIDQFVVRKHELDIVLEVLRGNIDSPSCQHVLVVAPRGRGKTMLLARVAAEVNTNHELSESLLPVRFMEESHEIFNLADFWLDTLFYLARESSKHDSVLAEELQKAHADLTNRWHEETLADRARAAVLEAADRLGKKLVLMVENLQALCGSVDKHFGWKLRGSLQSEPQIILLATATSRFEGLDDAEQPFFELFRIVALEPLATEECRRLWQVVSGDAVSQREIRPLEILTGGSPRLLVIVAEFARHRSLRQLMEELVELIDDHTEYFRGHLEVLAKGERRVYIAMIDLWQPSSTGEVAARARMDVRAVSTLLGRLVERGAVIVEGNGKKRRYVAVERLYSIYYKLRRERDEAAVIANLIRFMAVFYSNTELADMSGKLIAEATRLPTIREGIERAIAEQPQLGHLFPSTARQSIDWTSKEQLFEEVTTALNEGAFEKVIEIVDQAVPAQSANWSQMPDSLLAPILLSFKGMAHSERGEFEAAITTYDKAISIFGTSDKPKLPGLVAQALFPTGEVFHLPSLIAQALFQKGEVHERRGEFEMAIAAYDEVIARFGTSNKPKLQEQVAEALFLKGNVHSQRGDSEAAIAACDEIVSRFETSNKPKLQEQVAEALFLKDLMQIQRGDSEAAIAACDKVIARFGTSDEFNLQGLVAQALLLKGELHERRGDFEAAIAAYDEVIARFGTNDESNLQIPVVWTFFRKSMIQIQTSYAEEALHMCEELERRLGTLPDEDAKTSLEWRIMCVRTLALMVQEKRQSAMDAFRSAYAAFLPNDDTTMHDMQEIVPVLIANGASAHDLVEILSSDKAKSSTLAPLIVALRQHTGEAVRAPAEVLEVAADIRERIETRAAKGAPVAS